jgi:hypothetical protein
MNINNAMMARMMKIVYSMVVGYPSDRDAKRAPSDGMNASGGGRRLVVCEGR